MSSLLISRKRLLSLPGTTRSGADNSITRETVPRRASYLQRLMDHLWSRWIREYIPALTESHGLKLDSAGQTVQIGDIVRVHDESLGSRSRADKGSRQEDEGSSRPHS